ncbi:MAG: hypothetical protein AB1810_06495 [Pseudomonadota bacterium]
MKSQIDFAIEPFAFESEFELSETGFEKSVIGWNGAAWQPEVGGNRLSTLYGGTTGCPRGLTCLDHYHIPKKPDPTRPSRFVAGALTKLEPRNMNPGFIDSSDNLVTDRSGTGLQTCLNKLVTTQFQNFLSRESIQKKSASRNDRLRIGLIDLTGSKLTQPDFAGWGSTVAMYGASVPKILALYAAFQLRSDLRSLAISSGKSLEAEAIRNWKDRGLKSGFPNLVWLFDIRNWSGNPNTLDFTAAARNVFQNIMHNAEAGELIVKVGFPYIASVAWQSGLYHPARGGLWLTSSYGKGQWGGNPLSGVHTANVTALSAATFFTLLAQGRLVDDASAYEMRTWLGGGCYTGLFPQHLGLVASKCGIWSDYLHDCVLIVRGSIRYVVVGLTRTTTSEYSKYTQLFLELDKLIERNNQTPKLMC